MRIAGRITLFGEAYGDLIGQGTFSIPTKQVIASDEDAIRWSGPSTFDRKLDTIGRLLEELGYIGPTRRPMRADLPVEYGLASSTVLCMSHLGALSGKRISAAVKDVDEQCNGFRPSGADFAAVSAQRSGVFGLEGWTPYDFEPPSDWHLLLPVKERKLSKVEPTSRMRAEHKFFVPMFTSMLSTLLQTRELDTDVMLEYSRRLNFAGVYSTGQASIVSGLLKRGIVAKGVGAMYDRAILVLAGADIWDGDPPCKVVLR